MLYLSLEFGVKSLPGLIFVFTFFYRFFSIRHIAKSKVRYTRLFIAKLVLNLFMAIMSLAYMIITFVTPSSINFTSWLNACEMDFFALIYIIQVIAWTLSCFIMIFEYHRLLSESWYANQLFWILNLVAEAVTFYLLRVDLLASPFMITTVCINLGVNGSLVVMMFFTTKRTE